MTATLPTASTPPGTAAEVPHRRAPALLVGGPAGPSRVAYVFAGAVLAKTAIITTALLAIIAARGGR